MDCQTAVELKSQKRVSFVTQQVKHHSSQLITEIIVDDSYMQLVSQVHEVSSAIISQQFGFEAKIREMIRSHRNMINQLYRAVKRYMPIAELPTTWKQGEAGIKMRTLTQQGAKT